LEFKGNEGTYCISITLRQLDHKTSLEIRQPNSNNVARNSAFRIPDTLQFPLSAFKLLIAELREYSPASTFFIRPMEDAVALPAPASAAVLHSVKWNLDCSAFSVASPQGFKVIDAHPINVRTERYFGQGIGVCENLYRSNIAALVGGGPDPAFPRNKVNTY
jgi:hypothetical protein